MIQISNEMLPTDIDELYYDGIRFIYRKMDHWYETDQPYKVEDFCLVIKPRGKQVTVTQTWKEVDYGSGPPYNPNLSYLEIDTIMVNGQEVITVTGIQYRPDRVQLLSSYWGR